MNILYHELIYYSDVRNFIFDKLFQRIFIILLKFFTLHTSLMSACFIYANWCNISNKYKVLV
jgi:hypothetical protein